MGREGWWAGLRGCSTFVLHSHTDSLRPGVLDTEFTALKDMYAELSSLSSEFLVFTKRSFYLSMCWIRETAVTMTEGRTIQSSV